MLYNSDTLWVVQFYSHWCGHCQRFAPFYKELAASISGQLFSWNWTFQFNMIWIQNSISGKTVKPNKTEMLLCVNLKMFQGCCRLSGWQRRGRLNFILLLFIGCNWSIGVFSMGNVIYCPMSTFLPFPSLFALTNDDQCWPGLTSADQCWPMLTNDDQC